jgi:hypothetical protein
MNYLSFSLRKSGTHPLASWVLSQLQGPVLHFHNSTVTAKGTANAGQPTLYIGYRGAALPVKTTVVLGDAGKQKVKDPMLFSDTWGMKLESTGTTEIGSPAPVPEHRYYGFENTTPEAVCYSDMWPRIPVADSKFLIWIRDPLDNLASLITSGKRTNNVSRGAVPGQMEAPAWSPLVQATPEEEQLISAVGSCGLLPTRLFAASWVALAESWVSEYPDDLDVVRLRFDLWGSDKDYRQSKAEDLGLEFTDAGFDNVPHAGGGSSVSGIERGKADEIRSRSRGRQLYSSDPDFKDFVDRYLIPKIGPAYEAVFGKPLDPTM